MLKGFVYIYLFVYVSCAAAFENFYDDGAQGDLTRRRRQWDESSNAYDYNKQTFENAALNILQDFVVPPIVREKRDAFYDGGEINYYESPSNYKRHARQTYYFEKPYYESAAPPVYRQPTLPPGRWSTLGGGLPIYENRPQPPSQNFPPRSYRRPPPPFNGGRAPPTQVYVVIVEESTPAQPPRDIYTLRPPVNNNGWENIRPPPQPNFDNQNINQLPPNVYNNGQMRPVPDNTQSSTAEPVTSSVPINDLNDAKPTEDDNKKSGSLDDIITELFKDQQMKEPQSTNKTDNSDDDDDIYSMIDVRIGDKPNASSSNNTNGESKQSTTE